MSVNIESLIIDNLDTWSLAIEERKATGRGSAKKISLYGIQKLRELILELAIRGKLVKQDPTDEPAASVIKAVINSRSKKSSIIHRLNDSEIPKSIPHGWEPVRLGGVFEFHYGKSLPARDRKEGKIKVYGSNGVVGSHNEYTSDIPCIVIGRKGSAGALNIAYDSSWVTDVAYYTTPPEGVDLYFSYLLLKSLKLESLGKGIKPGLNRKDAYQLVALLPPQKEQIRIVEKFQEINALCDDLERVVTGSVEAHYKLVAKLLDVLVSSESHKELSENWSLLSEHFETLFVTEKSIESLKQAILQLAVTGRLVKQDSNDEPAAEVLTHVVAEKERLIKNKVIRRTKALPPVSEEEYLFKLPTGWEWCRLGDIVSKMGSGSTPRGGKSAYIESGIPFLRSQNIRNQEVIFDDVAYISDEIHNKMKGTTVFPNDVLLNITGASLGRCAVFPSEFDEANVSQHVSIIRLIEPLCPNYVNLLLLSPLMQEVIWDRQVGVAREGLSKKVLEMFEVPLPPMKEVQRIVEKVMELFGLCDKLSRELAKKQSLQLAVADSLVSAYLGDKPVSLDDQKAKEGIKMEISTTVSLLKVDFDVSCFPLGRVLLENAHSMDAKALWVASQLSLPEFYQSLKNEIEQGIIAKPEVAEFTE